MKRRNGTKTITRLTAILLSMLLFVGMVMPAYASNDNDDDTSDENTTEMGYITFEAYGEDWIRYQLEMIKFNFNMPDLDVDAAVKAIMETGYYIHGNTKIICGKPGTIFKKTDATETFNKTYQTSKDAKTLGKDHIGYDWAEIDWSHANDGYVRVKLNKEFTKYAQCSVNWVEDGVINYKTYMVSTQYKYKLGEWLSIPLFAGNREYAVTIGPIPMEVEVDGELTDEQLDLISSLNLVTRFKAEIKDANAPWLVSSIDIDYENAPLTRAKALEITKDCKTDAEKVTAVFNWVAKNIKYDKKLAGENKAYTIKCKTTAGFSTYANPFKNGTREFLVLDNILKSKSGVCEDYATLMVGMLRSLGIPCKYVGGRVYTGEIVKGYSDDGWAPHAWVAISPDVDGLNKKALGAGTESDGWIRLDPTWGGTASGRTKAAIDKNHEMQEQY